MPPPLASDRTPLIQQDTHDVEHGNENGRVRLVDLSGPDDPLNPQNSMPPWRKWLSAILLGVMTFATTFSSSVFVAVAPAVVRDLHSTPERVALSTTLFIFGFAAGPIIFGPASEMYGRKIPLFLGSFAFVLSQIPVALALNINTILFWRLFGGVASSSSPAIVGGYLADFLKPVERGVAIAIFAATTLIGPSAGAIIGNALIQNPLLSWRWAAWLSLILGAVSIISGLCVVPETYMPVLLQREARRLRKETGDMSWQSKADQSPKTLRLFAVRYVGRPFAMLLREPILVLMTLYVSFTFGMTYFLFVSYNFSFAQERGLPRLEASLPLLAIVIGIILGSLYVTNYTVTTFAAKVKTGSPPSPEDRLPPMIMGGAVLPMGLIWFAATANLRDSASLWLQIAAGVPIGAGIQIITLQALAYCLDIYASNANSAISATVIVRSFLGGFFPLLAMGMYRNLGVQWATYIVALVALCFFPVPVLLYFYGKKIRSWGKYVQA